MTVQALPAPTKPTARADLPLAVLPDFLRDTGWREGGVSVSPSRKPFHVGRFPAPQLPAVS